MTLIGGKLGVGTANPNAYIQVEHDISCYHGANEWVTMRGLSGGQYIEYGSGAALSFVAVDTFPHSGAATVMSLTGGKVFIGHDTFGGSGSKLAVLVPASGAGCLIKVNSTADAAETMLQFQDGAGQGQGAITSNPSSNTTAYGTSSDYRLKENVSYTWDATTRLKQLKPARFNWIKQGAGTVHDGFLAHEVSAIVPSAIVGAKDAVDENDAPKYQSIDQAKLVPLLVKTIQELEASITTLEG